MTAADAVQPLHPQDGRRLQGRELLALLGLRDAGPVDRGLDVLRHGRVPAVLGGGDRVRGLLGHVRGDVHGAADSARDVDTEAPAAPREASRRVGDARLWARRRGDGRHDPAANGLRRVSALVIALVLTLACERPPASPVRHPRHACAAECAARHELGTWLPSFDGTGGGSCHCFPRSGGARYLR